MLNITYFSFFWAKKSCWWTYTLKAFMMALNQGSMVWKGGILSDCYTSDWCRKSTHHSRRHYFLPSSHRDCSGWWGWPNRTALFEHKLLKKEEERLKFNTNSRNKDDIRSKFNANSWKKRTLDQNSTQTPEIWKTID